MSSRLKAAIAITALLPIAATATVAGGSNFNSYHGYPSHGCHAPQKLNKPYELRDPSQIDQYNREAARYKSDLNDFNSCIKEYLDNANNDILRIKEKVQEASKESKSL